LDLSNHVTVKNISIKNVDASYVNGGVGGITIGGSRQITVDGGVIIGNPNMDGILSLSYQQTPSYGVTITGVNSSYNGGVGGNPHAHSLGDSIDLINTGHVYISNCLLRGSGNPADRQPAIWIFIDDDVVVANSDLSDGSAAGVSLAGSRDVHLIHDSINRNEGTGVFVEWQAGTATNVGMSVSYVSGVSGGFGLAWVPGTPFVLDGIAYKVASVTDSGHLTLAEVPPDHSTPVGWAVNSNLEIRDVEIEDNGLGKFGGQNQDGISWADDTQGLISGVTATDTGASTQLYGLQLAQTATAYLYGDDFLGNVGNLDGIYAQSESHMYPFPLPLDPPSECTDRGVPDREVPRGRVSRSMPLPIPSCVVYCAVLSSLPNVTFAPCRLGSEAEPQP
jgi:Right handed beta helix region